MAGYNLRRLYSALSRDRRCGPQKKDEIRLIAGLTSVGPSPSTRPRSFLSFPLLSCARVSRRRRRRSSAPHRRRNFRISPSSPHPVPSVFSHRLGARPLRRRHLTTHAHLVLLSFLRRCHPSLSSPLPPPPSTKS